MLGFNTISQLIYAVSLLKGLPAFIGVISTAIIVIAVILFAWSTLMYFLTFDSSANSYIDLKKTFNEYTGGIHPKKLLKMVTNFQKDKLKAIEDGKFEGDKTFEHRKDLIDTLRKKHDANGNEIRLYLTRRFFSKFSVFLAATVAFTIITSNTAELLIPEQKVVYAILASEVTEMGVDKLSEMSKVEGSLANNVKTIITDYVSEAAKNKPAPKVITKEVVKIDTIVVYKEKPVSEGSKNSSDLLEDIDLAKTIKLLENAKLLKEALVK